MGPLTRTARRLFYGIGFFISVHLALAAYVNSAFLAESVGEKFIGIIFAVAAVTALVLMLFLPQFLWRWQGTKVLWLFMLLAAITAVALPWLKNPWVITLVFLLYYSLGLVARSATDILLEDVSLNNETGVIRGLFLTFQNVGWFLAPAAAGFLIGSGGYSAVYLAAGAALLPAIILGRTAIKRAGGPAGRVRERPAPDLIGAWRSIWCHGFSCNAGLKKILAIDFLLNLFFAVSIIYVPLHLLQEVGFTWESIGLILTLMLLPYLLVDFPLGLIADRYLGEKEIMIAGFAIIAVSAFVIALTSSVSPLFWVSILFLSRVGAAAVEIMKDSYFFKQIEPGDEMIVSIFRNTVPLSYLVGPLLGTILLSRGTFSDLFLVIGLTMILGAVFAWRLVDTR
jgi:MFS family permease